MEFTIIDDCLQPYFLKSCKEILYMSLIFFLGVIIDQDIVNVSDAKFVQHPI